MTGDVDVGDDSASVDTGFISDFSQSTLRFMVLCSSPVICNLFEFVHLWLVEIGKKLI